MPEHEAERKATPSDVEEHNRPEYVEQLENRIVGLTHEVSQLRDLLERLQIQQYVRALLSVRHIMWANLLSGVFSGLGAVVGATLGVALLVYILGRLEVVPVIGRFVSEIVKIVQQQKH